MKLFTIEVPEDGDRNSDSCGFDIIDCNGLRCNGLNWGELIDQVVSLTHPRLDGTPQYKMMTDEEWENGLRRAAPVIPKHDRIGQAKPRAWMPPDNEGRPHFMVYAEPGEDYIPLFELSSFD